MTQVATILTRADVTPSHQYPLGSVLSLERRLAFLHGVQQSGGWLIEDD